MYSSEKGIGINWFDIIAKLLFLIVFVLILMWFMPKASNMPNMTAFYSNVFRENIFYMKDASKDYYTVERMPKNVGDVSTMSLQDMINKNLILPFVDKNGNACDADASYVQVTKQEKEYSMKVNLVCQNESHYIIDTIGCYNFDICDNCNIKPTSTGTKTGASKTNYIGRVVNTVKDVVVPKSADNKIDQTNHNNTSNQSVPSGTNNQQQNASIVNGNNNTINQTNSNVINNTTNVYKPEASTEPKREVITTEYSDYYYYSSLPWVNADVHYKTTTSTLKVPRELDKSNIYNVRIYNVKFTSYVDKQYEINNYTNYVRNWYTYSGSNNDYSYNYFSTRYLATNYYGAYFSGRGMDVTWSTNYSCSNNSYYTHVMTGTYKNGGTWSQNTCMVGANYKVKFAYDIRR